MFDIILTNKSEESQICKYFENISFEVNETTEMKSQAQEKHINIAWPWKQILKLLFFLQFLNSTFSRFSGPSTHSPFVQKDAVENSSSSVISYNLVANTKSPWGAVPGWLLRSKSIGRSMLEAICGSPVQSPAHQGAQSSCAALNSQILNCSKHWDTATSPGSCLTSHHFMGKILNIESQLHALQEWVCLFVCF